MRLSALDNVIWAAGFTMSVALLCVLIYRRRFKATPFFTALIALEVAETVALFWAYKVGPAGLYTAIYWPAEILVFCLQLAVVVEIARIVLRPMGTWVQDARKQFVFLSLAGIAVAALLAWMVSPPTTHVLDRWEIRGNLFRSLLICEMVMAMTVTSNKLGLGWRSHVMALGQGLTVWSVCGVTIDVLHSYFGRTLGFTALEHFGGFVYVGTLGYWIIQLWSEEPVRQPISHDLQELIVAMHRRVQIDLERATSGIH